jgi:V-type H+-transporting ATPase subunit d
MATFNILHGFPEALVRGMRCSFLADSDYHHMTQCDTLDDVKLNLTETDYGEALADSTILTPSSLQEVAIDKVRLYQSPFRVHERIAIWGTL